MEVATAGVDAMMQLTPQQIAGKTLRRLIRENYTSQQEFADEYGMEIRSVNRYINNGINKLDIIQELAQYFNLTVIEFLTDTDDT